MALTTSSRPTRSYVNAKYEGLASDIQQPVTNENPSTIQRFTTDVSTRAARVRAASPATTCVYSSSRRRSIRSAKTPPSSVRTKPGAVAMNASSPSQNGELVNCNTSHPCATACIHVPTLDRNAPIQKRRKLRWESARNIPLRRVVNDLGLTTGAISVGMKSYSYH